MVFTTKQLYSIPQNRDADLGNLKFLTILATLLLQLTDDSLNSLNKIFVGSNSTEFCDLK